MKKFWHVFNRSRKSKENFYSFYVDAKNESPSEINLYKNFHFDSIPYCSEHRDFEDASLAPKIIAIPGTLSSDSAIGADSIVPQNILLVNKRAKFKSQNLESVHSDVLNLKPATVTVSEETNNQLKFHQERNVNQNTRTGYVICISNSKQFHIGSQKTINVSKYLKKNISGLPTSVGVSSEEMEDLNKLFDCDKKLTDESITLISLNMDTRWREFVKTLGLEESLVAELESRNDGNEVLALYDALHKFLTFFPNTSLGYIVCVLSEHRQFPLLQIFARTIIN